MNDFKDECLGSLIEILKLRYLSHKIISPAEMVLPDMNTLRRSIDSLSPVDCPIFFAFQKYHLRKLYDLSQFPNIVTLDNRTLRGLYVSEVGNQT